MKQLTLIGAFLITLCASAQEPLFTIGDQGVTADEFKAVYLKNRDIGKDIDPKTPNEYLDLYINFKLKVKEAHELGMDTMPSFIREFESYRKQLAQPYLEDRKVDSLLLYEAYSRMQLEVRAAHIMVDLSPDALPADTLAAYNKIMNIRSQAIKGSAPFDVLAKKFSTDPGSASNGGDLGYFTVFNMVYPFETAAYTTPVGEISKPVRSQFGYHIVKTLDKRPARGTVVVKHIFLISNEKTEAEKANDAAQRIQEIYTKLQAGESFDQLARQFSDDKNTSEKGGQLPPFGINAMMPEFEEASFALKNTGDYSAPFKTSIGWHIVSLVERVPVPAYADVERELDQKISRDSRSAKSQEVFLANLKKEYNFTEYPKRLEELYKVVDESFLDGKWDPARAAKLKKPLFKLNNIEYNQQAFVAYMAKEQGKDARTTNPSAEVYRLYNAYVDATIMGYENEQLERKYPEFRLLVNEYRDGILLFDLTQKKVWNAASQDSLGLSDFYEANKQNYLWPERADADYFNCENEKVAKKVAKMAEKGSGISEIEAKYNKESKLEVISGSDKFAKGKFGPVDQATWQDGALSIVQQDGRFFVVRINKVMPPEPKKLEEARGLIISDYQKQLESNWIADLKARYPVTINTELFRSIEAELN
jgi:peptidyl-prolyl cis-trans isomerase SurA